MHLAWMRLLPVREAEGVDAGGNGAPAGGSGAASDGAGAVAATAAPADSSAEAKAADGVAGQEPLKVAVDGSDPAPKAGEAGEAKEGEGDKKEVKEGEDEFAFKPEDYKFELPDGMPADEDKAAQFAQFAIDKKLPPEMAQAAVDFYIKERQAETEKWLETYRDWEKTRLADPEYGGADYEKNMAIANVALREFGGPKLGEAARTYGWGNHPEFVRMMVNVGRALGPGATEKGGGNGNPGTAKSLAEGLYGKPK